MAQFSLRYTSTALVANTEFLTLVGEVGIALNLDEFQFAERSIDFTGFRISESAVEPLPKYWNAIKNFPTPPDVLTCSPAPHKSLQPPPPPRGP